MARHGGRGEETGQLVLGWLQGCGGQAHTDWIHRKQKIHRLDTPKAEDTQIGYTESRRYTDWIHRKQKIPMCPIAYAQTDWTRCKKGRRR
eukprot:365083-Chlamydomonas_euryale.AAC.43